MKRTGLYFGSFNPIHTGHLIVAEYFATQTDLDEVWLVISPLNPLKNIKDLASEQHRLEMVKIALADNSRVVACDIEFNLSRPSYSVQTLKTLSQQFPDRRFTILLGEDAKPTFHLWKDYEWILSNFPIRFFPRYHELKDPGVISWAQYDVKMADAPRIEISSTQIRKNFNQSKSNRYLIDKDILKYCLYHSLYQ